jgi:hypothetical protein
MAGVSWLVYSLVFPFYRIGDILIASGITLFVHFIGGKLFPPSRVYVEVEETIPPSGNPQADEMVARGRELLKEIKGANGRINHPVLSAKITALEEICMQMFKEVQRSPRKAPVIRRALDYYLPVVLKMLNTYDNMESQTVQGGTVLTAMGKIEGIMDTVLEAFRNQLDGLYKDEALDISTDITVLQGMLAQEGLLAQDGMTAKESRPLQEGALVLEDVPILGLDDKPGEAVVLH